MARVFIVEDHTLLRTTLRDFLLDEPDLQVVGDAGSAETALEALEGLAHCAPDVVLVDVSLPGMSGIEFVKRLARLHPHVACVMLSGHGETDDVEDALAAGARGYVVKGSSDEVPAAIRTVLAGDRHVSFTPLGKV